MLVASLVVTCIFALMGVLQTLSVDDISATLARMLVPTISAPSRTMRISSPIPRLSLGPVVLPSAIEWTTQPQLINHNHRRQEEAPYLPPNVLQALASKTAAGVPAGTGRHALLRTAGIVVAASVLLSCAALLANILHRKLDGHGHAGPATVIQSDPEVRLSPQRVSNMKYFQRPTSKAVDDGSVFSHGRAVVDHRRTHRSYRSTPRNVLAPTDPNSSACHITPALRVTPIAINTPSWNGDHTNRRIFGVPISAQGFGRVPSGLDDLDDGTYLRDALGLIDWSDVPPQCGYWPTLDADFQGEDEVRPYTPWYMADEDLRGWVFPAGRVRPDRSEPDELSVAGEG